jgi:hypothetical protein
MAALYPFRSSSGPEGRMTITQTVDIPDDRQIIVPREVPTGKVVLTFTPLTETDAIEFADATAEEVMTAGGEILDKHIAAFKALAN